MDIEPGSVFTKKFKTGIEHSAKGVGSGDVEVLSTPSLIGFMENTCRTPIDAKISPDKVTVGTLVNIRHLKASKIGDEVEIVAKLLSVDGNRLTFWVEAFVNNEKIASGIHERAIVERESFLKKLKNQNSS